jgi:hypothetical protein
MSVGIIGLLIFLLFACNPAPERLPDPTLTIPQATPTAPEPTATVPKDSQEQDPFPLSGPGPYHVGKLTYRTTDASRDNREVILTFWYPAVQPADSTSSRYTHGAGLLDKRDKR